MYDTMTRVPLVLWSPGRFSSARRGALVELFDLGPTILELAGVDAPGHIQAESLAPMLDAPADGKEYVFCEEKHMVMIRGTNFKCVYYNGRDYGELYDLSADPHELTNLWDAPDCRARKTEMINAMEAWYARTGGRHRNLRRYL
jgi:arylsulfatase A-like enzyme